MEQLEQRSFSGTWTTDGKRLSGIAAVYNSPTMIQERGRTFTEIIRPGAFRAALESKGDIIATFNHDPAQLLGRTSSGTLRLSDTDRGLAFELDLPETQLGNDIRTLVNRGDIRGASFTFSVRKGGELWNQDRSQRELTSLFVAELGPVTLPAYRDTSVAMRSTENLKLRLRLAEIL